MMLQAMNLQYRKTIAKDPIKCILYKTGLLIQAFPYYDAYKLEAPKDLDMVSGMCELSSLNS